MRVDPSHDYYRNDGVLPGFAQVSDILLEAMQVLTPTIDLTPSECAKEYRVIKGMKYDLDATPYMNEPMEMTVSRRYKAVIYVGTVQSGKATALVENVVLHRMICDPCDIHITQMDKESAGRFSKGKIDKMLRENPTLRERLRARGQTLGNVFNKDFNGGATLSIGWPVPAQLASRDIPLVITTDRDRIGDDIGGEGDILPMMLARNTSFGSRGMSILESSPGREITDETWVKETIHQAPPTKGILSDYNQGTRGRYYWKCPGCKKRFEPEFKHLKYDDDGSPFERGESAYMVCPHDKCGTVIEANEKHWMNLEENGAGWLHEDVTGKKRVKITAANIRKAEYASYWQKGPVAAYQPWADMVSNYLSGVEKLETTGAESTLKGVVNTKLGEPYLSKNRESNLDLSGKALSDRAEFRELGVAPKETCFITISVDVQPSRFVVSVDAWGPELERWLVDRFDLATPPKSSPGAARRGMQSNLYFEDWAVLDNLHERLLPIAGTGYGLRPLVVIIDSNGAPGTTDRAYKFWRAKHRKRLSHIYYLYKGVGGNNANRAKHRQPENQQGKKYLNRDSVKIVFASTNKLKDEIAASLVREEAGPGTFHLPETLPSNIFEEFCAERRTEDGWEKKPGHVRNESLDLGVMGKAAIIVRGAEKINWNKPPMWALGSQENSFASVIDAQGKGTTKTATKPGGAALAAARANFVKRR